MKTRGKHLLLLPMLIAGLGLMLAGRSSAQTFTNLRNFVGYPSDGANPSGGLILSGNTLYGTAQYGGANGNGTVFALSTNGSGFSILFCFKASSTNSLGYLTNSDGVSPDGGLILSGNTLYGTAQYGGTNGNGTVFALNTNGSGFSILHTFTTLDSTNSDGANPNGGLILSGKTLYGTAQYGGANGNGTVFALNTNGSGFSILHTFTTLDSSTQTTNSDGANPNGGLILSGKSLYGTARYGGANGNGTAFALNTNGSGFSILHTFTTLDSTNSDGANPNGGLILSGKSLYGTAQYGGTDGNGTVFALNTNRTGLVTLYGFTGGGDGANPNGGLILSGKTLCGTAQYGGADGNGTVFALNTNGSGFSILHTFTTLDSSTQTTNSDGANPNGGLILSGKSLYGTAQYGGADGNGTVFRLSTNFDANNHLFGHVRDSLGNPVVDVFIYADDSEGYFFAGATDGTGYFSLNLGNGTWNIYLNCAHLSLLNYGCPGNQYANLSGGSYEVDFTVHNCTTVEVINTNLPVGLVAGYYDQFLEASGCNNPFTWSLHSGSLPPGLQLSPGGELSGTPINPGKFGFSVSATDANSNSINQSVTMNVISSPSSATIISTPALSNGRFQFTLGSASGYNFTIQSSTNLINWLNLYSTNVPKNAFALTFPTVTGQLGFYRALQSGIALTDSWTGTFSSAPVISFASPTYYVNITNGSAIVTVNRTGGLNNDVCLSYSTSDGTAQAGVDYLPVSGSICFAPNQTSNSFAVQLLVNPSATLPDKTVILNLYNPKGSVILSGTLVIVLPLGVPVVTVQGGPLYFNPVPYCNMDGLTVTTITVNNSGPSGSILPFAFSPDAGDLNDLISIQRSIQNTITYETNLSGYLSAGQSVAVDCTINTNFLASLTTLQQFDLPDAIVPINVTPNTQADVSTINVAHRLAGEWHGPWSGEFVGGTNDIPVHGFWVLQLNSINWNLTGDGWATATYSLTGTDYWMSNSFDLQKFQLNSGGSVDVSFAQCGSTIGVGPINGSPYAGTFPLVNAPFSGGYIAPGFYFDIQSFLVGTNSSFYLEDINHVYGSTYGTMTGIK